MKLYNELVIEDQHVLVDGIKYTSILAKHCVWIPDIETKVILSFQGHIESTAWIRGKKSENIKNRCLNPSPGFTLDSLYSVVNEFEILRLLSSHKMSPKPKQLVYFSTAKSKIFTDDWYTDNKGMFGYEIEDANKIEPGQYSFDNFQTLFLNTRKIETNPGAIGDLEKKEGNLVNGHLVDVRRTMEYMMQIRKVLNIDELLKLTHNKEN